MKKSILSLFLVILLTPSIVSAAWWNPFSWFNNWSFSKKITFVEVEEKIPPEIIENITTVDDTTKEVTKEVKPKTNTKSSTTQEPNAIVTTKTPQELPNNISVRCSLSRDNTVDRNQLIKATLKDISVGISKYNIVWDSEYLINSKDKENKEAVFSFNKVGRKVLSATVTRISDGYVFRVDCPEIEVLCNAVDCLSESDKKKLILKNIINEIDSWYNNEYPSLSPEQRCSTAESIIRAFEYEYTLMGGINIPIFSKVVDCANSVAPKAYQYKIQLLRESLQ